MKQELKLVQDFHHQINALTNTTPTIPEMSVRNFRAQLLQEEVQELIESMQENSLEETSKELADVLYVLYGTILSYGLQDKIEEIFESTHQSNMSKLTRDISIGKDSKAHKDTNYQAPDIESILK